MAEVKEKKTTKVAASKEVKEKATKTVKTETKTTKKAEPKTAAKKVEKKVEKDVEAKAETKKVTKKAEPKTEKAETKKVAKSADKAETKEVKEVKKTSKPKTKTVKGKAQEFLGTGKRKCSVARVRLTTGTGNIVVNGEDLKKYFELDTLITIVKQPLVLTETENNVDIVANIYGGGKSGQAGALRHGITRALMEFRPELRAELKKAGFVTRDARKKERKKYGLHKARKAPQFSKR